MEEDMPGSELVVGWQVLLSVHISLLLEVKRGGRRRALGHRTLTRERSSLQVTTPNGPLRFLKTSDLSGIF